MTANISKKNKSEIDSTYSQGIRLALFTGDVWEHVCPMLRIIQPSMEAGIDVLRGIEWDDGEIHSHTERINDADLVVIQRDFPIHRTEYLQVVSEARLQRKPIVYDIDDLLIDLSDEHPDISRYKSARFPIMQAIVEADAVTSASPQLCEFLTKFNQNSYLLPNYLNDGIWHLRPVGEEDLGGPRRTVIGYMGGHSHLPDIEMVEPVLIELLERYAGDIALQFWGIDPGEKLKSFSNVSWEDPQLVNYERFVEYFQMQTCDLFFAPLKDNAFNRYKSSLKFLEYSAFGIPGVYSRLQPYENVVIHGENGFLAGSLSEWKQYLSELIEKGSLRKKMGENAQETVRSDWLLSNHKQEWLEVYSQVVANPPKVISNIEMSNTIWQFSDWYEPLELARREKDIDIQEHSKQQAYRDGDVGDLKIELSKREKKIKSLTKELDGQKQRIDVLIDQTEAKELELDVLRNEIRGKENEIRRLDAELGAITRSSAYQVMKVFWRLRNKVAPTGSRRQRLLNTIIRAIHFLSTQGPGRFFRRVAEKLRFGLPALTKAQSFGAKLGAAEHINLQIYAEPGIPVGSPPISILVLPEVNKDVQIEDVSKWVGEQTLGPIEIVIWSQKSEHAYVSDVSKKKWKASTLTELLEHVRGEYIAIASVDLLRMPPTYLESNLITLETESIPLTINFIGNENWDSDQLINGFSPGNLSKPLLRQVVRKDLLIDRFQVDFSPFLEESVPAVIGKVIVHTKSSDSSGEILPFDTKLDGAKLYISGHHLIGVKGEIDSFDSVPHRTSPVDTVMCIDEETSDRPTVLIVMPFLAIGGAERVALDMVRELHDEIRFVIVTIEGFDPALGTTVDAFRELTPYVYTAPDFLLSHLNYSLFVYLINQYRPTTLYIANGAAWIYDALSALKTEFPELRFANQVYDHKAGWINRYDKALVRGIEAHIGVNRSICRAFLERGVHPDCVYLIENGVDSDEYDYNKYPLEKLEAIKRQLGVPLGRRVVTQIGRMHPQKRPMDFVELARRFRDDESLFFLLVGDGPLTKVVNQEIERIQHKNILHHPFYQPSNDIYAISDVVVMSSEYEGMPMVILEALSMGTPVAVTDVGNNREILEKTKGGVIVDQIGNPAVLAKGLLEVLNGNYAPADLRKAVIDGFSLRRMARSYQEALLGGK